MKRLFFVFMMMSILFGQAQNTYLPDQVPNTYRDHQAVTSPILLDKSFDLSEIEISGLKNVSVLYKNKVRIDGERSADIYIFTDNRFGGEIPFDSYLGIFYNEQFRILELDISEDGSCPAYDLDTYIADVNEDGSDEIMIQQCVSMTGGAGGYRSRVFQIYPGSFEISTILDSSAMEQFDTGFKNEITEDAEIKIYNTFTDKSALYEFVEYPLDYMQFFYTDSGEIRQQKIMVDSFYQFMPFDVDDDGVHEIVCKEYVSLIGHTDFIGTAKSVLKWDHEKGAFAVYETDFIPGEHLKCAS